jgi:hypothetical protein
MKRTSPGAFTVFDGTVEPPVKSSLAPNETVIGWYRNPPPWEHYVILFTSEAFYLVGGEHVERIPISDILGYEWPESKTDVAGVRVLTKDGFRFVRVSGSYGPSGQWKDAFSFIMVVSTLVPGREPVVVSEDRTPKRGG